MGKISKYVGILFRDLCQACLVICKDFGRFREVLEEFWMILNDLDFRIFDVRLTFWVFLGAMNVSDILTFLGIFEVF